MRIPWLFLLTTHWSFWFLAFRNGDIPSAASRGSMWHPSFGVIKGGQPGVIPKAFMEVSIWVWVKIRYPNNWMVNTKLDISICGPISVFHFDPHPYGTNHHWGIFQPCLMTPKLGWLSYDTVTFQTPETNGSPGTADPTKRVCLEMAKLLGIINIHISWYIMYLYIAYEKNTHCNRIKWW